MPSVSCAVDLNTNPLASFSPGGGLPGLRKKRVIAQAQLPLESRRVFNEPVFDGGIRTSTCSAFNGVNTTTVNITVEVLGMLLPWVTYLYITPPPPTHAHSWRRTTRICISSDVKFQFSAFRTTS